MSEASPDRKLGAPRKLRDDELRIIRKMAAGTSFQSAVERQLAEMEAQDMPDGGMGSIQFYNGIERSVLEYGNQIAEAAFKDADGVSVSVILSVDRAGQLFDLDMFKADGTPLVRYPETDDLAIVKRDKRDQVILES